MNLPPGQSAIEGFPRFGTHLNEPAPAVPAYPVIKVEGELLEPFAVAVEELASQPRQELLADFHCVAGWSATDLLWEGVPFAAFYRTFVEPALRPGATVTHLVLAGLDGYRAVVTLEDALADDVLIADRLDGGPLDGDHGAPARFVSPGQYGFVNTKHLSRIEVHDRKPRADYSGIPTTARVFLRTTFAPHPRARVWEEERHRRLPGRLLRPMYGLFVDPIMWLCERGSGR